jgi:glutamate dehydrogenase (NADP+)
MEDIHRICSSAAIEYGEADDYMLGANIGGFIRVADAMIAQGTI